MNKRLLIRPGGLGDCITCFPAMQHLRAAYTEVWVPSAAMPLVQFADDVASLASTGIDLLGIDGMPTPERLLHRLRSFDEIVSWYGTARPEFREALTQAGPPCRFLAALPPADYGEPASCFFARQVGAHCGIAPKIHIRGTTARNSVVIHPFSGSRRKNWPLSCFEELAARLPLPVEWIAGPEEELAGARRFDNLLELAQWIGGARLYIGNDAGVTHLAAAAGTPVLAIFGPTDPAVWAPPGVAVMRSESLSSLHPSAVLAQTLRLLKFPEASNGESASAQP